MRSENPSTTQALLQKETHSDFSIMKNFALMKIIVILGSLLY